MATEANIETTAVEAVEPLGKTNEDPFAAQRSAEDNPFSEDDKKLDDIAGSDAMQAPGEEASTQTRRMSREWDASKVPPSRFQKRKGSIYSTPGSRDGQVKGPERDKAFHEKLKEKGWNILSKAKK